MTDPTVLDPELLDLLVEWEESIESGAALTVEELCARCPDKSDELRRRIEQIGRIDSLFTLVDLQVPPALQGFEQLEEIGRGGMGVVYKAKDIQLDQVVAIKIPFASKNGVTWRRRFERESRTLAKLRHDNIVRVRSAGIVEDSPFLVMDYVGGGNLAERMQEVAGTPTKTAQLMIRVARAVDHAHRMGIVHRDLKPGNILLSEEGAPLVSDFGVATVLSGDPLQNQSATDTPASRQSEVTTRITRNAAAGTPAYLPPEASSGDNVHVAASTDVWSLGVILYECLTGRLPFLELPSGKRDYATTPPRPRSIRRDVPRALERITKRCLAIDPAKRYATAAGIATDLENWMARVEWTRRAKKVGLYGAACAAVLVVVALLVWPLSPEEQLRRDQRALASQLMREGKIELIGPSGKPKTHVIRVNQPFASADAPPEGNFFVDCSRICLVELLPDVPGDRYLFTAELRQMRGKLDCDVGLYCGHTQMTDSSDEEHRFVYLTFADLGLYSDRFPGPDGELGSALRLRGLQYRPSAPVPQQPGHFDMKWYQSVSVTPGPWRRLSLEISAEQLRGQADGIAIPFRNARAIKPTIASPNYPRGGIGIYVNNCRVEVRNCSLKLISTP